jgi:hypothetical protein
MFTDLRRLLEAMVGVINPHGRSAGKENRPRSTRRQQMWRLIDGAPRRLAGVQSMKPAQIQIGFMHSISHPVPDEILMNPTPGRSSHSFS